MATIINADTSDGLKLTSDTSGQLELQSAGSTKVTMNASGNVGIGGTPSEPLSVFRTGGQEEGINIRNTSSGNGSRLTFETTRSDDSSVQDMAAIQVYAIAGYDSAANSDAIMTFQTQDSGTTAERMRIDNSGNVFVGPTATQNGATGVVYSKTTAKAWVTFTGSTGAILSSFNVSSVTRVSAGYYTVNFTSAMPNANYSSFYMAQPTVTNAGADTFTTSPTTTSVGLRHWEANVSRDSSYSCFVAFGSA